MSKSAPALICAISDLTSASASAFVRFFDTRSHRVSLESQPLTLTTKEYSLLEFLARNCGRIVTREEIAEHVWNQDFDTFTNVIDVYVNYLRNKIDRGRSKKLIHTIRGSGYMLKAD